MKKRAENIMAVIFFVILTVFMSTALTVKCGAMNPVRQQIKEESMIM